ncbi:copper resistance protein NlpE [Orbus sturtevantii]|uniref:copper resistance protein NlpE n=1 Tax=Orbus sturtevantii TaxID=3074109 RepID=UPI00370D6982
MKKLAIILAVIVVTGCSTANNYPQENIAKVSLDWPGLYQGIFPCADCEAIGVSLTLNDNDTFKLERTYKKGKWLSTPQATVGKFTWNTVKPLIYLPEDGTMLTFFVGEGYVTAYAIDGNRIESNLNFTLTKVPANNENTQAK